MVDLNVVVSKNTTKEEINELFRSKMDGELKGIIHLDEKYMVSQDIQGSNKSSIVAADLTQVVAGNMIKVMAWYDNEWGYSTRLVDMALYISK
jgi:glyceraldehyde 3-phosphate dehydrogenase